MKTLVPIALALMAFTFQSSLLAQTPAKDADVVRESQEQALEQAKGLEERATDPRAKGLVEAVKQEMDKALKHLATATNSPSELAAALAAEQAAYQALLKLSAREYQVSRSRSQKGQQSSS